MSGTAEIRPGDTFVQRYEIQQLLGEGDRKRNYRAWDRKLDRFVAISFVKPEAILSDPEGTEREAKVLGRIGSHDNIVSVYDYDVDPDVSVHYIVFEYLGGGTLADYLNEAGARPLGELLALARQLCGGLGHLHKRGLIHRDVSPNNIWLDEGGVAHLGDFDSAIPTGGPVERRPITANAFAAPEETNGGALGERSDLYSLGGVLYVAATGRPRPGEIDLLRTACSGLPTAFTDLLAEMLAESADERPRDAETVLARLDEIRETSVDALIAEGESGMVEFKSSLHHAHGPLPPDAQARKQLQRQLNREVTRTIAAFLNTDGGTLLIGVADDGEVVGIEHDYKYFPKDKRNSDGWLLSLHNVISNSLDDEIWSTVRISVELHRQKHVAIVRCPRRQNPTWYRVDDKHETFFIRAANATKELCGHHLVTYISEHWSTQPAS